MGFGDGSAGGGGDTVGCGFVAGPAGDGGPVAGVAFEDAVGAVGELPERLDGGGADDEFEPGGFGSGGFGEPPADLAGYRVGEERHPAAVPAGDGLEQVMFGLRRRARAVRHQPGYHVQVVGVRSQAHPGRGVLDGQRQLDVERGGAAGDVGGPVAEVARSGWRQGTGSVEAYLDAAVVEPEPPGLAVVQRRRADRGRDGAAQVHGGETGGDHFGSPCRGAWRTTATGPVA
ncbi:hypothetical protein Prum_103130 [Phytohabitans rumicis]|uniref:Uncharacterized protein n=1 Tax=Phytohabitans rumicis TaxID=1076125 RepID=A0A6V8LNR7_9ACTN|nr:hypothetical protein Prum_103130 [Phytohabitans rumicis]